MWKKEGAPEAATAARPEVAPGPDRGPQPKTPGERAAIGRSITIKGEVTGDEDLLIQGRVDGSVDLKQHSVTVGREGEVKADIAARVITVEGSVEGNLKAEEQIILRSSALVQGDISAPRVVLEDGARFRGGVDTGETVERPASPRTEATRVQETGRTAGAPEAPAAAAGSSDGSKSAERGQGAPPQAAQITG